MQNTVFDTQRNTYVGPGPDPSPLELSGGEGLEAVGGGGDAADGGAGRRGRGPSSRPGPLKGIQSYTRALCYQGHLRARLGPYEAMLGPH